MNYKGPNNFRDAEDQGIIELELIRRDQPSIWTKIDRCHLEPISMGRLVLCISRGKSYPLFCSGPCKWKRLHQVVFELAGNSLREGECIDHINGDGLDNRGCNLRAVTIAQNSQNQRVRMNSSSALVNIIKLTRPLEKPWRVHIATKDFSPYRYLKYFATKLEAIAARDIERARRGMPIAIDRT